MYAPSMFRDILSYINTEQEQKDFLAKNDPEYCFWLAYLYEYKFSNEFILKLSEVVLESGDENIIKEFYNKIDFDKTKYNLYFKNLIFK